jgi:hypothetical protein
MYLYVFHEVFLGEINRSGRSAKSSVWRNVPLLLTAASSQKNVSRQIPVSSKKACSSGLAVRLSAAFAMAEKSELKVSGERKLLSASIERENQPVQPL